MRPGRRAAGPFLRLLRSVFLAWVTLAAMGCVFQRRLLYFPHAASPALPAGAAFEDLVEFTAAASDGVRVRGWHWPYRGEGPGGRRLTFFILHGNAGNRAHRLEWMQALRSLGASVCIVDYRGYGGSEGSPHEEGLYRDARAALDWLEAREPGEIIYTGESMGTGVAVELARDRPPAAMILQSAFTSMADVGALAYPFLPVRWLLRDRYESTRWIGQIRVPILFIHGEEDDIVPIELGRRLHALASGPKEFLSIPGAGHNDLPVDMPVYLDAIRSFLGLPGS